MIDNGLDPADRARFVHVQWKFRDTLNRPTNADYSLSMAPATAAIARRSMTH